MKKKDLIEEGRKHLLKTLVTPASFARRKKVTLAAVRKRIQSGDIEPVLIGADKEIFIDLSIYKHMVFKSASMHRTTKPVA